MKRHYFILFFSLLLSPFIIFAQTNPYAGSWKMEVPAATGMAVVSIELQIASPENNLLYPAKLLLHCGNFSGAYELLLVKKNSRELGISKNKFALLEKPFSLRDATFFLNGILDYSRDMKGEPVLTIRRIQTKQYATLLPDTAKLDKAGKAIAMQLTSLLKDADIRLSKLNSIPLKDDNSAVLSPSVSATYFGLLDTIHLNTRDGSFHLTGDKKKDIVTVALNGRTSVDMLELSKKAHTDEILLDTGLNTLILFADNFDNELPSRGRLNLEFGTKKINLDFNRKEDSAASFIVAKLYVDRDKAKDIYFQEYTFPGPGDKPLQSNEKLIGGIISNSQQLTLAIWDDAVEDGDSISININGKWIARGFPVKKQPQFITLALKPGANNITFVADNLGSIPPNTSVLEIIDGKKRKAFFLETVLGENNLIKIQYDIRPN